MGAQPNIPAGEQPQDERAVLRFLIADTANPSAIICCVRSAREIARTIRDMIPREVFEHINELHLRARDELSSGLTKRGRFAYLKHIVLGSQTLTGMLEGTMNDDEGACFLSIGRQLERADMTTRILDVLTADLLLDDTGGLKPYENIQWVSLLKSLTAYQMYRLSRKTRVRRAEALEFLLQDEHFPRSVTHCVAEIGASLARLPRHDGPTRALGRMQRTVHGARPAELSASELSAFLDQLQIAAAGVHAEIASTYFMPELHPD